MVFILMSTFSPAKKTIKIVDSLNHVDYIRLMSARKLIKVLIVLDSATNRRLSGLARRESLSRSAIVRRILSDYITAKLREPNVA